MRRAWHMAVVALSLAPLAGCHLLFGYSAGESPGERPDLTHRLDSPRPAWEFGPGPDVPPDTAFQPCSVVACPPAMACCEGECFTDGSCKVKLQATADTYVSLFYPDANFGNAAELRVSNYVLILVQIELADVYVRFPVPPQAVSGRQILSAVLHLRVTGGTNLPVNVDIGVMDVDWEERAVTSTSSKCDADQSCNGGVTSRQLVLGRNDLDVGDRVRDLAGKPNATGLFIWRPIPESSWNEAMIASREHATADFRPVLEITYK